MLLFDFCLFFVKFFDFIILNPLDQVAEIGGGSISVIPKAIILQGLVVEGVNFLLDGFFWPALTS